MDKGANWTFLNIGLDDYSVNSIAIDPSNPDIIYAGGFGVFSSLDGGRSWSQINADLPIPTVTSFAIGTSKTGTIYIATSGAGILQGQIGITRPTQRPLIRR